MPPEFFVPEKYVPPSTGPVEPKDAATVILLRTGTDGIEVFLQRRVAAMKFAAGMTVFPGGGVDERDSAEVPWAGPPPSWWASRFDCPTALAQALVCAAVRETFEESGVLLAGPDSATVVADVTRYREARAALVARAVSLAQFLTDAQLVLRADLLRPWSNWVTPVGEPRRYDTRFLLAALPAGQQADGGTSEAVDAEWQTPRAALADWEAKRRVLMPPTWYTLSELTEYDAVDAVLAAADGRRLEKCAPKLVRDPDGLRVVLPNDPRYAETSTQLDP